MGRRIICGWVRIADALNVSVRTAQRYAKRPTDPLRIGNLTASTVGAYEDELLEWGKRNESRSDGRCVARPPLSAAA